MAQVDTQAQQAADQLHIPVENVLGLTAWESGWGESRFAREGSNYLGIEYLAPYAVGFLPASGGSARLAIFGSYADCLSPFVRSYSKIVYGVSDAENFATNLQNSGSFGIQRNVLKLSGMFRVYHQSSVTFGQDDD